MAWGTALGAAVRDMTAYQGHGSVATPHGVLITWALMMEGGFQVNSQGRRFSNEHLGYSEQCVPVIAQPGRVAWNVYDERLHRLGMEFEDYRGAHGLGAIRSAGTIAGLASACALPIEALAATFAEVSQYAAGTARDPFGRDFTGKPALAPPYYAVKVTGALFHTQGGLVVDEQARVLDCSGCVAAESLRRWRRCVRGLRCTRLGLSLRQWPARGRHARAAGRHLSRRNG